MHLSTIVNALFLLYVNVTFVVAGIFLNAVVIISLLRSPQLRKKPCYFMILVLSCFDLAMVAITHPVLIVSTITWSMETNPDKIEQTRKCISFLLGGFTLCALLTLNIERFLALIYPFFHHTAVTKRRLIFFLALLIIIQVSLSPFVYLCGKTFRNILITLFVLSLSFVFICINYKMFIIAKSKRNDESVAPTGTTTCSNKERKRRKLNFKNISTCSLAVGCFFVCLLPQIIYSTSRLISNKPFHDRQVLLFNIWSVTFLCMNSTFNCLIFFWRNSILRREGMKIAKWIWPGRP